MAISVQRVTKQFGTFAALEDVSVDIADGSLTALLGPSGSGKSTLLRIISGLERPDSGRILISGRDVTKRPAQQRGVGFVFQHYAAFKHMTVWDNVAFGLKIRKRSRNEIRDRVTELLHLVQLNGFEHRFPAQLSGGQRQRMALARALAIEPNVLLLDEPFGALDKAVRNELRAWLRRLHDEVHVTTVLVTHDQDEAMDIADQIVMMNHGRIEQSGEPRQLYEEPANPFVMTFLGHTNQIGDVYVRPHDVEILDTRRGDTIEAVVQRIVHLGFEVRVELARIGGEAMTAQTTRARAQELELRRGQTVHLALASRRTFELDTLPELSMNGVNYHEPVPAD